MPGSIRRPARLSSSPRAHPFACPESVCTTRLATVVVNVDDAGVRRDALRDLVRVAGGRYARAEVEELPHPGLGREVANGPAEEGPVGAHPVAQPGRHREHPVTRDAVGCEVVFTGIIVINAGHSVA